jgi:uncharacterized Zn-finger protein
VIKFQKLGMKMNLKFSWMVISALSFLVYQGSAYANCPALAGQYHCQGDTGEFQLEIQQTVDSSSTVTYRIRERATDCNTLADFDETFQVDLSQSLDSAFRAQCTENSLIVPLQLPLDDAIYGNSTYSLDQLTGKITHTKTDKENTIQSWICSPLGSVDQTEELEEAPEFFVIRNQSIQKRTFSDFSGECDDTNTEIGTETEDESLVQETESSLDASQPVFKKQKCHFCSYEGCEKNFASSKDLRRHEVVHTKHKKFVCEQDGCGKSYTQKSDLKRHVIGQHSGQMPYLCPFDGCGKGFVRLDNFRAHEGTHEEKQSYECDSARKLQNHEKRHVEELYLIKKFVCEHEGCGKDFSSSKDLRRHEVVHTKHKKFVCEQDGCGKSYTQKSDLKRHSYTHSRQMPHPCLVEGCGKGFARSTALKRHMNTHKNRN